MLRNNELRELARQLDKSSRTSLLSETEKRAAVASQEIPKEKVVKKKKTNE